ncbi:unnamed protein product [Closterium sp. NIES-64]|nr:unnamed protein product [Closterium sp. NIES-64]CAI6004630.1 unnamed protein product [Closterium sp. NIES-64]
MEEFKKSRKECVRDHMCATDECKEKTDRCIAKAYKRFKICKFPPKKPAPQPPSCKKLCKMLYNNCKKENKGSCGMNMKTSALLCGLVLLSVLLLAVDAIPAELLPALESDRRILHDDDDDDDEPSCLDKYKKRYAQCEKNEKKCEDKAEDEDDEKVCEKKSKTCEAKAYRSYKSCKYGKWGCKDWCKYYKRKCYSKKKSNCEEKYEDCKEDC